MEEEVEDDVDVGFELATFRAKTGDYTAEPRSLNQVGSTKKRPNDASFAKCQNLMRNLGCVTKFRLRDSALCSREDSPQMRRVQ